MLQELLVVVLGILGSLMTVLLAALGITAITRGLRSRQGLSETRPEWEGCPSAWVSRGQTPRMEDGFSSWPDATDWVKVVSVELPAAEPTRPYVRRIGANGELLFLPGRLRGNTGWWVVLLEER